MVIPRAADLSRSHYEEVIVPDEATTFIGRQGEQDRLNNTRQGKAKVFVSYSHADRKFASKLAQHLKSCGVRIWIDEGEINVGDSLIEKIRQGIDSIDYLIAIVSKASISSEWVKRELDIAMNKEIETKRVVVLPVLLDRIDLPGFLKGKLYADFTDAKRYKTSLHRVLRVLAPDFGKRTNSMKSGQTKKEMEKLLRKFHTELCIPGHEASCNHREEILKSHVCGCFFCLAFFKPEEVFEWWHEGQTAVCPRCGIDSVIGSASGLPMTERFLRLMKKKWFSETINPGDVLTVAKMEEVVARKRGLPQEEEPKDTNQ